MHTTKVNSQNDGKEAPPAVVPNQLAAFGGVFTPSILTIPAATMFLRVGLVIGQSNIFDMLLILLVAKTINSLTSLTVSAVSTNTPIVGGGRLRQRLYQREQRRQSRREQGGQLLCVSGEVRRSQTLHSLSVGLGWLGTAEKTGGYTLANPGQRLHSKDLLASGRRAWYDINCHQEATDGPNDAPCCVARVKYESRRHLVRARDENAVSAPVRSQPMNPNNFTNGSTETAARYRPPTTKTRVGPPWHSTRLTASTASEPTVSPTASRLCHRCHIFEVNSERCRFRKSVKASKKANTAE